MKKKLPACIVHPSSRSSVHPSFIREDEDCVELRSVNKAKVIELLGASSPQEYLEINDLLRRAHHTVDGSPSCARSKDNDSCGEYRSDDDIDKNCAFPLPFHPANQERCNSACTDMITMPVPPSSSRVTYVESQHRPAFVQELAALLWMPKLFKFQWLAGKPLKLDGAIGRAKSLQLQFHNAKEAKPTNSPRQEGNFPLPQPCSEKHYLPSPVKLQALPIAHPLPPPGSISNEQASVPSTQEASSLPDPLKKLDMQFRAPYMTSLDAPNPEFIVSTSHKPCSLPSSARQSPRRCPPGSRWSVPNSSVPSPGTKTLCPRRWRKGAVLGQGTFGVVHEGLNLEDGSFFAVKVSSSADVPHELQQEVDLLSKLEHPNIVRYLGSSIEDGRLCIFLELVRMGSLQAILRKYKRFEDNTIRSYTRQILLGLEYLHSKKTMHRDIKCANILVDVNGQVKLSDFGVAKEVDEALASSVKGTPLYMAPEVLTPNKNSYSFSADIWSLGCTVLEMADGKPPWSNLEGFGFLFKVKRGELPSMPEHLSLDGKDFVCRCLKFHAKDRPTPLELLQHPFVCNVFTPELFIPKSPLSPGHEDCLLSSRSMQSTL